MCGEQICIPFAVVLPVGSPPRVRGTEGKGWCWCVKLRITPACAGNSSGLTRTTKMWRDHPRVCGEQRSLLRWRHGGGGSPPRVRGTEGSGFGDVLDNRITPACAGNSSSISSKYRMPRDHPRVCGEQIRANGNEPICKGSPPRVRGTDSSYVRRTVRIGITPACAGNSQSITATLTSTEDHPRVCGEQTKKSPSFLHSFLSDQENSFSLKYNCNISSQSFCARWTSLQGSSKCFAKVDS